MSDLIKSLDNLSMNTDNKTPKDQVLYNKKFKNVPKLALETNGHSETNGHLVNNLKSSSIEDLVSKETKEEIYQLRYEVLREQISKININELTITEDDLKDKFCDPDKPVRITFNDISAAAYRIKGGIENTPCTRSHMSDLTGMEIYFKKDFLQYTGSFKERGARYALLKLSKEQKLAGVVAASAGNHAQALCYHGKQLKIPVLVVMPRIAPIMKISNCRSYGSLVLVEGIDLTESKKIALKLSKLFGMVYINGYDHPDILAGQGTMALEIIEQVPDLDAIIIPTGGGGLLAGVSTAAKAIRPDIRIISAESIRCPGFYNSCKHNATTFTKCESTLADGLAVSLVGANAFASANPCTDKSVCVSEEYIAIAILRLLELEKAVVEGAGATGFAAVLEGLVPELKGKKSCHSDHWWQY